MTQIDEYEQEISTLKGRLMSLSSQLADELVDRQRSNALYTDERGHVWTRPSAFEYSRVVGELQIANATIVRLSKMIVSLESADAHD